MRPRNVLTETNDMRRLMGLPLLSEDTGDSIKDIKKKVLNETTPAGFSLGFAKSGGLTIDKKTDAITEIEKAQKMAEERELKAKELNIKSNKYPMEANLTEQDRFYTPSDEEVEYWKEKETPDEENAFTDWLVKFRVRLFSARGIGEYKQVTDAEDWEFFLNEWLNSDEYTSYKDLGETIEAIGDGEDGLGEDSLDQVVAESKDVWGFSQYNITLHD